MRLREMVWACGVGLSTNYFGFGRNSSILHFHQFHYQFMSLGLDFGPKTEIINDTKSIASVVFSVTFHTTPTMQSPNNACMRLGLASMACLLGELKSTIA